MRNTMRKEERKKRVNLRDCLDDNLRIRKCTRVQLGINLSIVDKDLSSVNESQMRQESSSKRVALADLTSKEPLRPSLPET